ncbi:MAG: hypothetical protein CHACPFDD_01898 [Phycisphaerae bacterium]|nr:hypothetical protein [Phycisphaerae bacterium]
MNMSHPADEGLERLISRCLDHEATPHELRRLNERTRRDAVARALRDEITTIDRDTGQALRRVMRRTVVVRPAPPVWQRIGRALSLAAAACLAIAIWTTPAGRQSGDTRSRQASSLFLDSPWADAADTGRPTIERPHIRRNDTERRWIVVPSDRAGEYMLIEVNRVKTRVVGIHQDY